MERQTRMVMRTLSCLRQHHVRTRSQGGATRHYSSDRGQSLEREAVSLPKHARVVIAGGGIIGPSVAYHLTERGWTDVVLLEQGSLTCGTTWHSVGMIGQLRANYPEMEACRISRNLYARLEEEGHGLGWKPCGGLNLARRKDRWIEFKRKHSMASAIGLETHLLSPKEIEKLVPLIKTDDLIGGIWLPSDGVVTAPDVSMALMRIARERGAKFLEGVKVEKILTKNDRVTGVETSSGNIDCEYFVNCAGQWAREIGKSTTPKVRVPLHSCEHFYLVTKPLEEVDRLMPG